MLILEVLMKKGGIENESCSRSRHLLPGRKEGIPCSCDTYIDILVTAHSCGVGVGGRGGGWGWEAGSA